MCPNSTEPGPGYCVCVWNFTILQIYVSQESVKYKHKFNQSDGNLYYKKIKHAFDI